MTACGPEPVFYEIEGKVVSVDTDSGKVTLAHEAIPGFMDPMTMPFTVLDRQLLPSMQNGDRLVATLVVRGPSHWLEDVVVSRSTASGSLVDPDAPTGPEIGSSVPNVWFTNQDGARVEIGDYEGKALLVTFVYTRCPLLEFCPRMNGHFGALEEALAAEPSLYAKTHLLTVSFDPEFDTPELLRAFALQQPAVSDDTFSHWEFVTGTHEQVREIGYYLGLTYRNDDALEQIVHNLRTALVGPDGTLSKLYRGNEWTPEEALADISVLVSE